MTKFGLTLSLAALTGPALTSCSSSEPVSDAAMPDCTKVGQGFTGGASVGVNTG